LWKHYHSQGLDSLLSTAYKGSWAKLSSTQQARLLQRLDKDDISTQEQLLKWLREEMGIVYSQPGISVLLARLKVKLKTGRPVNVRKDEAGEAAFKKTFPS
jgi:transposase